MSTVRRLLHSPASATHTDQATERTRCLNALIAGNADLRQLQTDIEQRLRGAANPQQALDELMPLLVGRAARLRQLAEALQQA